MEVAIKSPFQIRLRQPRPPFQRIGKKGWWIDYRWKGVRHVQSFPTRALAIRALEAITKRRLEARIAGAFDSSPGLPEIPINSFFERFRAHCKQRIRASTWITHQAYWSTWSRYLAGQPRLKYLSQIDRSVIDDYLTHRLQEGKKRETVNHDLTWLRNAFNRAVEWGLLVKNPTVGIKRLDHRDSRNARCLKKQEVDLMLSKAIPPYDVILGLYAGTGARLSELLNSTHEDFDLKNGWFTIRSRSDSPTKTGKTRKVPIPKRLIPKVSQYLLQKRSQYPFRFNESPFRCGVLLRRALHVAARKAGIGKWADLRVHDLRHTYATRLAEADVNVRAIQALLGHATITMTARYSNPSENYLREAVGRIG